MRIVNCISGKDFGGSKQAFLDYGLMLEDLGYEVHYLVRPNARCLHHLKHIPKQRIHVQHYHRTTCPIIKQHSIQRLYHCLKRIQPSIIFAHKQIDLALLKPAYPQAHLIGVIHGFNYQYIEQADQLITVSSAVQTWLKQHTQKPLHLLANSVKTPSLSQISKPQRPPVIGTMTIFRRKKKIEHLLKACKELKRRGHVFQVLIAGRGHRYLWLKSLIQAWGLTDVVSLHSWIEDKSDFFKKIDIYCVTSRTESFNISLLEAMAHQTCVVSSACGGPNDIIIHEKSGYLFPVGNITTLVQQLEHLIVSPTEREKLAQAGFKRVLSHFSQTVLKHELATILGGIRDFDKY